MSWRFVAWWGATGLGVAVWLWFLAIRANDPGVDVHAYYVGEYGTWGVNDSLVYAPAFSQAIEPLRWLGWPAFAHAWRLGEIAVLVAFAGPFSGLLVFANPVALEILAGNIHLYLAAAIVAGFRWPALWAFVLLTKVTPGIGLLWFVVRREWRKAAIALGATAAVVVVSFALDPGAWFAWLAVLRNPPAVDPYAVLVDWPLWLRLPAAAALVTWGARTDRRWTVLVAAFLALPAVWLAAAVMLVPFLAEARHGHERPVHGKVAT